MRARRWIGVAGALITLTGLLGVAKADTDPRFEAEVALRHRAGPPFQPDDPASDVAQLEAHVQSGEVRDRVHQRLGYAPPVRLSAIGDRVVVVRTRATTPELASEAATTYATSYLDVRRDQARRALGEAAGAIQKKLDQLQVQIDQADGTQRGALSAQQRVFAERLDEMMREPVPAAEIIRSRPGVTRDDGIPTAWVLTALGVLVLAAQRISCRRVRNASEVRPS